MRRADHVVGILRTRARSRRSRSGIDGGSTKMLTRSPSALLAKLLCPCQSMSNSTSRPCASAGLDRRARRAIDDCRTPRAHSEQARRACAIALEARAVDEMIVAAVDLARPLRARRHRDRQLDARIGCEELARQRGLAGARRRRQHQHEPAPGDRVLLYARRASSAHSRFCTCSRNCSTTVLSSRPILVSSTSFDLAHSVLDSRLSSWRQKVELAPDRAAVGDQLLRLRDMRGEPVEFLADVGLGGDQDRLLVQPVGIEAVARRRAATATCSAMRALIASALAAGRGLGARGERRDLVEPRAQDLPPSASPSCRRISARLASACAKPATTAASAARRSSSRSSSSMHLDHALEREDAVERGGAASTAPGNVAAWSQAPRRAPAR